MNYKKIGIFGLGISGKASLCYYQNKTRRILCWDDSENNRNNIDSKFLCPLEDKSWKELDAIIVSPGIPGNNYIFELAANNNIKITSDIEIFLDNNKGSKIIIVTGTDGKSTVASLIFHILKKNQFDYHLGGNIGFPVLSLPFNASGYVLELSSFQLDLLKEINPDISVLTNIEPDHLDRYGDFESYISAKEKAFFGDGFKIIGIYSEASRRIYEKLYCSGHKNLVSVGYNEGLIKYNDQKLTDNFFDMLDYNISELPNMKGRHNKENISCAYAVCRAVGVNGENVIKYLSDFPGLKHRMQFIGSYKNMSFYNDSKATNVNSALSSLSSLTNIFWIAGGIFKSEDLLPLEKAISNVKKAYLFGKNKLIFEEYLHDKIEYILCNNMEEAFDAAVHDAAIYSDNANILLAPACASFDQFKNFEDRGDKFINLYNDRFKQK